MALLFRRVAANPSCRALADYWGAAALVLPPFHPAGHIDTFSWASKREAHHCSPISPRHSDFINDARHGDGAESRGSRSAIVAGRCFSSSTADYPTGEERASGADGRTVVYKGKGQRVFRVLVRLKIAQLTGVAAAVVPIATYTTEGSVPLVQLLASGGLLIGCGVASLALWYYSSRYVGELSTLPRDRLMISTMDFWGYRMDKVVHVLDVAPPLVDMSPAALQVMAERALMPLNVIGDQQYFISVRHGHLLDKEKLMSLLKGDWGRAATQRLEQQRQQQQIGRLGSIGGIASKR